ncbi:MAG: DUF1595 domain-containing protein, partial [Planctomycetes bacterium]|nr:DUF1595 domain-containing protein [Planctomycetota bacterium]
MEKYLVIVDDVLDRAIRPGQMLVQRTGAQLDALIDNQIVPGKEDGAERIIVGATQLLTTFPAPVDGLYTIRVRAASERVDREPLRLAVRVGTSAIAGEVRITANPKQPGSYTVSCKIPAGKTNLALIVANPLIQPKAQPKSQAKEAQPKDAQPKDPKARKPGDPQPADKKSASPAPMAELPADVPVPRSAIIYAVEVTGPPAAQASELQRRLFVAMPDKDLPKREAARRIAETFARRAYRRPPSSEEIEVLLKVFELADSQEEVFSESVK